MAASTVLSVWNGVEFVIEYYSRGVITEGSQLGDEVAVFRFEITM